MKRSVSQDLETVAPELHRILVRQAEVAPVFDRSQIRRETVWVTMRDGARLATDLYLPPTLVAPTIAMRTPYGRAIERIAGALDQLARCGYVVAAQDCRGTGDSEPDSWDYYMHEPEDGWDFVEWTSRQRWFEGFIGACGGSYVGQTQWCMAMHPCMSTIVPEVSGLGVAINTAHSYMNIHAYARAVGKGRHKVSIHYTELERQMIGETLAGGYFNEPLHRDLPHALIVRYPELKTLAPERAQRFLWEQYCALPCSQRADLIRQIAGASSITNADVESLSSIFGHRISHDAHTLPHPDPAELCGSLRAPALMVTGWYDWGLNDALATWELLKRETRGPVRSRSRLIITPAAHNTPGYREGIQGHRELQDNHRTENHVGLLLRWYSAVREGKTDDWPAVIYYLMGANEWRVAEDWPPPEAQRLATALYLGPEGRLRSQGPPQDSEPDRYTYEPREPTPTVGGSIVSSVYLPGSVDVSDVQKRSDVLVYTTEPFERDCDVVGPLQLILYASSSAIDTDFSARLSDVFPDERAIQLQSGFLRARYRNLQGSPEWLEPGRIYRFDIDLWAIANRFKAGHRLRLDISSADFPRFDRNTNRGGEPGPPLAAVQTIYHDLQHPSRLILSMEPEVVS